MKRFVQIILLFMCGLVQLSGCAISPFVTGDISENPSLIHFDMNNPPFDGKIEHVQEQNKTIITANTKVEQENNKAFSVKYYRSLLHPGPNVSIPVEFPNRRKYAAYLDTGFDVYVLLTSDIVLDHKLAILPIGSHGENSTIQVKGICHIPVLNIGPAQIKDAVGYYVEQQWQLRIMNIPVYKKSDMILGLAFIKTFNYVLFDNIHKQVVFSRDETFEPDSPELWMSFPFSIKSDVSSNERIMVQMPIAGQTLSVEFDSCGDTPGLFLNNNDWQSLAPDLTVKRLRKAHSYSWQEGLVSCKKATVSQLSIGEKTLMNAEIGIFEDTSSIMSLNYFQDTVVVLDFIKNLLWIKK